MVFTQKQGLLSLIPDFLFKLLKSHLKQGGRLRRPNDMDNQWYDIMVRCWHEEPDSRPDFSDLVRFFGGHYKQLARSNSMGKIRNREKRLTVSEVQKVTVGEDESPYKKAPKSLAENPTYRPVAAVRKIWTFKE